MANYRSVSGTRVDHGAAMPNPKDKRTGESDNAVAPSKSNISANTKVNAATYSKTKVGLKTRRTSSEE